MAAVHDKHPFLFVMVDCRHDLSDAQGRLPVSTNILIFIHLFSRNLVVIGAGADKIARYYVMVDKLTRTRWLDPMRS
jgi:hypothetical protein